MNTLQLVLKNMRQRALSTWLTMLSVALGVALAISVIICVREGSQLFVQSNFGFNVLIGPKGDELRLVLDSVYGLGAGQGTIPWSVYNDLMRKEQQDVRSAIPFMIGDTWQGRRIVATSARFVPSPELERFRDTLNNLGDELRTLGRPPANEPAEARDARIGRVPAALEALRAQLRPLDDAATLAPLDPELVARFRELRSAIERAAARVDPEKPAMTDAAGRIAADARQQLLLLASFATPFEYRVGVPLTLAQGRAFDARKFEGVVGATAARELKMKLGDQFQLEHGGKAGDLHDEKWTVVGILAPTGTAIDKDLFIPLISGLAIPEHEQGMEAMAKLAAETGALVPPAPPPSQPADAHDEHDHDEHDHDADDHARHDHPAPTTDEHHDHDHGHGHEGAYHLHDGRIHLELTQDKWKISGIYVTARNSGVSVGRLRFKFMNTPLAMSVNPATTMAQFFHTFMKGPSIVLLSLSALVTVVAAISILVSIYNSVLARRRETAILRALGATRSRVLTLLCAEAAVVGLLGGAIGLVLGHVIAAIGSRYMEASFGSRLAFYTVSWPELAYLAGVVLVAAIAGLVPAMQAYRVPVAQNLTSE